MSELKWARVSPVAILYFFVTIVFTWASSLIYALPAAILLLPTLKDNPAPFLFGLFSLFTAITIASILKYKFYFYRLGKDRVEIRQGLIKKTHLDLPFVKIQNVKIIEPFYYRFSDYAILELDTAGSAQQEAKMVAIRLSEAESIRQKIQLANSMGPSSQPLETLKNPHQASINAEITLNTRSIKDLVVHGLTNNRIWIFIGFLAPFYNTVSNNIAKVLGALGLDFTSYLNYDTQTLWIFLLHVFSIVMLLMLIVVIFSIMGSIFVFYDYRLSKTQERYIRRSGLLTKQEVSMNKSRIQRAVQQQDWLDVLIGRVNLIFEQNTSGISHGAGANQINHSNKLIIPSVTPMEADELVADVFKSGDDLSCIKFSRVSARLVLRYFLFPCLPLILLAAGFAYATDQSVQVWLSLGLLTVALVAACILRWYRWGFAHDNDYIFIRQGFLGRDLCIFPIEKLQQIGFSQTPLMRKNGLATLTVVLASGGIKVPYLPQQVVIAMIDDGLLQIARDKPAWM